MFSSKSRDEKSREWRLAIDKYISLHKFLKEVGKVAVEQARSGGVSMGVQGKLAETLRQIDQVHCNLKKSFRPCFKDVDVQDLYREEGGDVSALKGENDSLHRQLIETKYETFKIQDNEQVSQKLCESLRDENKRLEDQVKALTQEMQIYKESADATFPSRKQNELEETLKIQNDLIYELKHQLADTIKERDLFRTLNKNLDAELRRNSHENSDYSNRSTLRVEEAIGDVKNLEIRFPSLEMLSHHSGTGDFESKHLVEQKEQAEVKNINMQDVECKNVKRDVKNGDEYVKTVDYLLKNYGFLNGSQQGGNKKNEDGSLKLEFAGPIHKSLET